MCRDRFGLDRYFPRAVVGGIVVKLYAVRGRAATLPVVLAMLALSSCGGGGSGGESGSTPTPTPVAVTPTPTPPPAAGGYPTLAPNPTASTSFTVAGLYGFDYNGDPATGLIVPNSPVSGDSPRVAFKYDQATQTYTLVTIDLVTGQEAFLLFSTPLNATNPTYTDAKFLGYSGTTFGQNATGILQLYRSGNANPELKLSYSGFGHHARSGPIMHLNFADAWFAYGFDTKGSDVPASGTASYTGVLHGFAVDPVAGKQFKVEGTSSLVLDFATKKASGTLNITLVASDGSRITVGAESFSDTTFGSLPGTQTNFGPALTGSNGTAVMKATLYGPGALEIAGVFAATVTVPSAGGQITLQGAIAAVKN